LPFTSGDYREICVGGINVTSEQERLIGHGDTLVVFNTDTWVCMAVRRPPAT